MSSERLTLLLERMRQASLDAHGLATSVDRATFLKDMMVQRAVGMSLLMAAEATTQLMDRYQEFVADHPEFPWAEIRGMRNRMAHGYFEINLDRVWDTATIEAPELADKIDAILHWRAEGE